MSYEFLKTSTLQNKPIQMLNTNNKSLFGKLKRKIEYFGDETHLHGIGHMCSLSPIPFFKRIFWLLIMGMCCFGAASVLQSVLGLYSGDVISYSVETDYTKWETPFPAVTVCEQSDRVENIKEFLKSNQLPSTLMNFFKDVSYYNPQYCGRPCANCDFNRTCREDFQLLTEKLRLNCSQLLTDCWWDGEYFPCCERFHPMRTEYGVCYTFNSKVASNATTISLNRRKTRLPDLKFVTPHPHAILIKIHESEDSVSVLVDNVLGRYHSVPVPGTQLEAYLMAESTVSDVSISALSQETRGCLYRDEQPAFAHKWPFPAYTLNTCVLYCRVMEQVQLCNCTHHLLPTVDENVPVCDIPGMKCLYSHYAELLSLDCECPLACEETSYTLVAVIDQRSKDKQLVKQGIKVRVRLAQLPAVRNRRVTIRGMLGLVVDIGGLGGVFFGASLLSVMEIIYLFFIRRGP